MPRATLGRRRRGGKRKACGGGWRASKMMVPIRRSRAEPMLWSQIPVFGFPVAGPRSISRRFTQRNGQGKRSLRLAHRLTANGLERCGLWAPVEHPENVPDVFNEEAVRRRAELGKQEQLLL